MRVDGRRSDELRPVTISTGVNKYAEGSALNRDGRHPGLMYGLCGRGLCLPSGAVVALAG